MILYYKIDRGIWVQNPEDELNFHSPKLKPKDLSTYYNDRSIYISDQ